jgi:hypothetical protein
MTWRAVLIAGIVAGAVFLVVNVIATSLLYEIDPALMLRYFASLVMGSEVLTQVGPTGLIVGLLVHFVLSIVFALLIAIVVHRWGLLVGLIGGAVLGLAIYAINLYALTRFFEWFFAINSPALLLSHVLFGLVAGGVYELFDHFDLPVSAKRNGAS